MNGRIVKSERILTKLRVLDYEYICNRTAEFHKKILFLTQVINIQILTTKYFSFQYSVTYCSQALRHPEVMLCWRSPDQWWCQLLWALWDVQICSSLIQGQKSTASRPTIEIRDILLRQQLLPAIHGLSGDFLLFNRTTLLPTEHVRQCIC